MVDGSWLGARPGPRGHRRPPYPPPRLPWGPGGAPLSLSHEPLTINILSIHELLHYISYILCIQKIQEIKVSNNEIPKISRFPNLEIDKSASFRISINNIFGKCVIDFLRF